MLQILTCRMDVADRYGLDAAVFLHNIVYWTLKNKAEERHYHDGRYWTYASRKALAKMYPLWSDSQIKRIISKLREDGVLLVGDFNEDRMVRTNWYAPSDELLALYGQELPPSEGGGQDRPENCPESPGALGENAQCLYNENKKLQQGEPPIIPQAGDLSDVLFERFWAAYPKGRRKAKKDAKKAWDKLHPDLELCRKMAVALEAQKRSKDWTKDGGDYIPLPATWIRGERWTDEITIPEPPPSSPDDDGVTYI